MEPGLFNALVRAAAAKGGPLSDSERQAVVKAAAQPRPREYWAARFHNVALLAGYSETAAAGIVAEWLDRYLAADLAEFEAMLVKYETDHGDDD